ncbi:histidine phosphatase family protein [Naasia lichenicola]|uniref:Histidine phosphatase family protein n=1 Tax=Naasia lichenicola TaxID=2565933 RepID=A0A4S4FTP9_9MICO|nr:histidine phosphatase family protein [Naasia lichenicola]THG33135.1 histidine phosphatase family protein [Naasia lichenicola]
MTHLVLVRHGQTDWNLAGRIQGSSDIPLNDTGRQQAREAGRRLAADRWDAIVSSPLSRAMETAQIIGSEVGIDVIEPIDALVERHYGTAEGMTGAEIDALHAEGQEVHGRETRGDVVRRVRPALIELAQSRPDQSILVVSHGGVIGSLVRDVTKWVWPEEGQLIANGSSHRFAYRDGRIGLVEFNGKPWKTPPGDPEIVLETGVPASLTATEIESGDGDASQR